MNGRYLEEAAALIRKAAEGTEREHARGGVVFLNARRLEYARAFALLAAIDAGLLPHEMAEVVYGQFAAGGS